MFLSFFYQVIIWCKNVHFFTNKEIVFLNCRMFLVEIIDIMINIFE